MNKISLSEQEPVDDVVKVSSDLLHSFYSRSNDYDFQILESPDDASIFPARVFVRHPYDPIRDILT